MSKEKAKSNSEKHKQKKDSTLNGDSQPGVGGEPVSGGGRGLMKNPGLISMLAIEQTVGFLKYTLYPQIIKRRKCS